MCTVFIGMCEGSIAVSEGEHVMKGDVIGTFHLGGSTHCEYGPYSTPWTVESRLYSYESSNLSRT